MKKVINVINMKSKLLEFYFGTLSESERLLVERQLLVDSEVLVNYLDLKRVIESAELMPNEPSAVVWQNLRGKLKNKKQLFIPFAFGAAAAAAVLILWTVTVSNPVIQDQKSEPASTSFIFDSNAELPASSGVL